MIKVKRLKPFNTTINLNARSMKHFYEKLIYSTFLALGSTCIQAQTTTENFIKTQECLDVTCATKKETVVYFDGLGREKQALQVAGSPTGKTIVTQVEYDGFGRQAKENLPFPITAATNTIVSAATNGNTFYSTLTGDTTPFSEKTFENSPLNRVLAQAAPGNSWKKGANEIKFDYATNTATEVQKFGVTLSAAFVPTLTLSGNYTAGTLYKTITTDENKQPIQEFKDKEGRVVLKRINIPSKPEAPLNSSGNHDTYYVYDIYGNLTFVLPPKLVEVGTTVLANYTANLAELGYQYQYDDKNRLIEKQLPGKGREFMVYDKLDRLVATRDSQNEWIFTKYDKFNRIVYTGTLHTSARATLQSAYNTATVYHETRGTSGGLANNGITNGLYTNVAYPTSFTKITTINYYDEYTNLGVTPSSIDGQSVIGVTDTKTKGLAVASFTNVLGTTTWAKNYTYYDAKYIRPVATASTNYLGGYTNTASSLDFRGKPLKTITKHKQLAASTELTLTDEFVYYPNELLKSQTHQINSGAKEYIVQNSYNEINQLTIKKVGNSVATTPLQTIDYKYNIRGWMTNINNVEVTETTTYKDLFAFSIYYDNPHPGYGFRPGKYNGNISQTRWKSSTDNIIRNYVYEYDNLNRLTGSFYVKGDYLVGDVYNEYANYDKNGNILNMYRSGNQDLSSNMIWIDDLTYSYKLNSNKLLAVTDASTLKDGFNDGNKTGDDYTYDTNGNLTVDKNKGITKISYNYLNLPTEVLWNASKKINYTYDASGVKLRKVVTDGATVTTTDYLGGFQYVNNSLQFFPTAEGYVNVTNGTAFSYVYNYTDHLGNVRLSYQKEANGSLKVLEENNYYPFGLKHSGYNNTNLANANYKYKYNGKELQTDLDINLYDYGARNYDPAIGRWFNIDPLAEKSRRFSPYTYALNNPVYFIDPDGMMATPPDDYIDVNGNYLGSDGASTTNVRVINRIDWKHINEDNGGSKSASATAELQASSSIVTVNNEKINSDINNANNETLADQTKERQVWLGIEITKGDVPTAQLTSVRGPDGRDGEADLNTSNTTDKSGNIVKSVFENTNLITAGQVHTHNVSQKPGRVTLPGTSPIDKNTSQSTNIPIYAIDSYLGKQKGGNTINRVIQSGTTNSAGTTSSHTIGQDVLNHFINKQKY